MRLQLQNPLSVHGPHWATEFLATLSRIANPRAYLSRIRSRSSCATAACLLGFAQILRRPHRGLNELHSTISK
jgi:hypothetical protein